MKRNDRTKQRCALWLLTVALPTGVLAAQHGEHPHAATTHELEEAEHILKTEEQVEWQDGPESLPAGSELAVLEGDPTTEGIFTMRLKFPDGYEIPPHTHTTVERVTVLSGTMKLGMGEELNAEEMQELPEGSFFAMPPGMAHFAAAEGETVVQLTGIGPWGINYINPSDDPRPQFGGRTND